MLSLTQIGPELNIIWKLQRSSHILKQQSHHQIVQHSGSSMFQCSTVRSQVCQIVGLLSESARI